MYRIVKSLSHLELLRNKRPRVIRIMLPCSHGSSVLKEKFHNPYLSCFYHKKNKWRNPCFNHPWNFNYHFVVISPLSAGAISIVIIIYINLSLELMSTNNKHSGMSRVSHLPLVLRGDIKGGLHQGWYEHCQNWKLYLLNYVKIFIISWKIYGCQSIRILFGIHRYNT